jgi:hypothetical protein
MPFIRGRYHIIAVAGAALEAAREAEAALLALERDAQSAEEGAEQDDADDFGDGNSAVSGAKGPIHRVEIEATELVPAHSGRAEPGFVARVHRAIPPSDRSGDDIFADAASSRVRHAGTDNFSRVAGAQPETHVFSGHRDLVSFLRDEFAKDCEQ